MSGFMKIHNQAVIGRLDRSYFPSVKLYVEVNNPGADRDDLDWELFLAGANNAAEIGYEYLGPRLEAHVATISAAYKSVELALEKSDALDIDALEDLLAARNTLASHLKEEWDHLYDSILNWSCGSVGLRRDYLEKDSKSFNTEAVTGVLLGMATRGIWHPFWAWAVATYVDGLTVTFDQLPGLTEEFSKEPAVVKTVELQKKLPATAAVTQYVAWARVEIQDVRRRVETKSQGMVAPSEELIRWVAAEIFKDPVED